MGEETGAAFATGSMIDAGGLGGSAQSTEIRPAGGEVMTTNGPWTEAVEGARRVVELHKEHWRGWEGLVEVRPILGGPEG